MIKKYETFLEKCPKIWRNAKGGREQTLNLKLYQIRIHKKKSKIHNKKESGRRKGK